jgi:hypothetical protein
MRRKSAVLRSETMRTSIYLKVTSNDIIRQMNRLLGYDKHTGIPLAVQSANTFADEWH